MEGTKAQQGEPRLDINLLDLAEEDRNKISSSPPNSGAFMVSDEVDALLLDKRWVQFLRKEKEITAGCRGKNGKLDVAKLVEKYNYTIESCADPVAFLRELSGKEGYEAILDDVARTNDGINGFSIPKMKRIFYKKGIPENQRNFVNIHELSHCILEHQRIVFYKTSSEEPKTLNGWLKYVGKLPALYGRFKEPEEYREEADKLAAILLMPHDEMLKLSGASDKKIAKRFGVNVRAVQKRKREVEKEKNLLSHDASSAK
jgi:hypothetical protein